MGINNNSQIQNRLDETLQRDPIVQPFAQYFFYQLVINGMGVTVSTLDSEGLLTVDQGPCKEPSNY